MEQTMELKPELLQEINDLKPYLEDIKRRFDAYDQDNPSYEEQIKFLESNKNKIFLDFDILFEKIWAKIKDLSPATSKSLKEYCNQIFSSYLWENIEINSYIRQKPLGYGGDYQTMIYIYDYNKNKYLGASSYSRLINNYTCNIPVACSNIRRKDSAKEKIIEQLKRKQIPKILIVGSGPGRELVELLREGAIKSAQFYCIDFEQKAIEYFKNELKIIEFNKDLIEIVFFQTNLIDLLKIKNLKSSIENMDFIYVSGVFDYLSQRLCRVLTKNLFFSLNKDGLLLIANMSKENEKHRAYYDFFGEWIMFHRTKEEMIDWLKDIKNQCEYEFEEVEGCSSYHFIKLRQL